METHERLVNFLVVKLHDPCYVTKGRNALCTDHFQNSNLELYLLGALACRERGWRYECMRVHVCALCLWVLHHNLPMVTVVFFCWLIPASPHACLTTQRSSLLASCPNQFICKQVCFFPLRPIVHTTPECIHNGRPLSHSVLLYSKVKKKKKTTIMFLLRRTAMQRNNVLLSWKTDNEQNTKSTAFWKLSTGF